MKRYLFITLFLLAMIWTREAKSLENFWYKDIALDNTGQILPNTLLDVRITIERAGATLYQETFTGIRSNHMAVVIVHVGTGSVNNSSDLSDVVDFADTRIRTEMMVPQSSGWVLSSVVTLTQVQRYSELNDIYGLAWSLTGNEGTNPANNFLGTIDDVDLVFRINDVQSGRINRTQHNTLFGYEALNASTAANNTAIGYQSLFSNTTGWSNTAIGNQALYSNTFRGNQVAIGDSALFNNGNNFNQVSPYVDSARCIRNVAVGSKALFSNEIGFWNTAVGYNAAYYNISGKSLAAIGTEALMHNTTGYNNTAVGTWALYNNQDGYYNTGLGSGALKSNVTGDQNTAIGVSSMYWNNGNNNVSMGFFAAAFNKTGNSNTAIGTRALFHNAIGSNNVAVGSAAAQSYWWRNCYNSVFIGALSDANLVTVTNSIAIGYHTIITANNQVRIGNNDIQSLYCVGAYNGTAAAQPNMVVNSSGQIMRSTSLNRVFNNLTVNGNTALGDNSANTLTVNAQINSNLIPDGTTRNLGSTTNRWGDLFLSGNSLHIGDNGNDGVIAYSTIDHNFTMDKPLYMNTGSTNALIFEGGTDDNFETTLIFTEPTADRTITFADANGTILLDVTTIAAGDVSGSYTAGFQVADNSHNHDASSITTDIVSSVDGVTNDGGNIDLIGSGIITITPDDANNNITINATETDPQVGAMTNDHVAVWDATTSSLIDGILTDNGSTLAVAGNLTVSTNTTIGTNSANTLTVNAQINSNLIPDGTTRNLGSDANRWGDLFISGTSVHIGASGDEAEINYTANSHLKFTKPVLTPNSIVSLTGNATYTGTAEAGLVLYVYNTSGTDYTFESINVPTGQMKVFVYTGSAWVATN